MLPCDIRTSIIKLISPNVIDSSLKILKSGSHGLTWEVIHLKDARLLKARAREGGTDCSCKKLYLPSEQQQSC